MAHDLKLLIEEAIVLEQNLARLYMLFYRLFPEDSQFWWKLSIEEQNHAALLKTVSQLQESRINIPEDFLPVNLKELEQVNHNIQKSMEEMESSPDRTRALRLSLDIENSAGEFHYNNFMKCGTKSQISEVLRKLNGDDIDHAERILHYMIQLNIKPL